MADRKTLGPWLTAWNTDLPSPVSPFTYIKLGHIKEIILKATEILGIFVIAVYTDKCNVFESGSFHLFFFFSFSLQQFWRVGVIIFLKQIKILKISFNKSWCLLGPNYTPAIVLKTVCSFSLIQIAIIRGRYYYYPILHMRKLTHNFPHPNPV